MRAVIILKFLHALLFFTTIVWIVYCANSAATITRSVVKLFTNHPSPVSNESNGAASTSQSIKCANKTMTLVSGYINIGDFQKGAKLKFTAQDYRTWIRPFRLIQNPIVFYTDDEEVATLVRQMRSSTQLSDCTYVRTLNRSELWGFQLLSNITTVIKLPGYPKLHPNTVVPEYGAVMHSKFSMLEWALEENRFETPYFAWMDSGLYRKEIKQQNSILLLPPPNFDDRRVAVNQVTNVSFTSTLKAVFHNSWPIFVGGGFFVATRPIMRLLCSEYRFFTEYFLTRNFSNTDQQVLYGMMVDEVRRGNHSVQPTVGFSRYVYHKSRSPSWYHLRWLSHDEGRRQTLRDKFSSISLPSDDSFNYGEYERLANHAASNAPNANVLFESNCSNNVTIVIAFFSIGSFAVRTADDEWLVRDSTFYLNLLGEIAKMVNPIVAYFDCPYVRKIFLDKRPTPLKICTNAILINRNSLWSWAMLPRLYRLLSSRSQAVEGGLFPEYVAALHSKFAVLQWAAQANPFNSSYFAWLNPSVGMDRKLNIILPETFNRVELPHAISAATKKSQSHFNRSGSEPCDLPFSTRTFIVQADLVHRFSEAYRLAAEITASWKKVLADQDLLRAVYCWNNITEIAFNSV